MTKIYQLCINEAPPISHYGYIGDCHSSALVSKSGSIDWCCMPRIDSASCFGRLLGWQNGGYCQIMPSEPFEVSQSYIDGTMVLVTHFKTAQGEAKLYDFFPMRRGGAYEPYQQIIRIVEGIKGQIELDVNIMPRFDYGAVKPWLRPYKKTAYMALGGSHGLLISSDIKLTLENYDHISSIINTVPNTRTYFSLLYRMPQELDDLLVEVPSLNELDYRLDETILWWQTWTNQGKFKGPHASYIKRSALVLKALSNAPTGAIAAAPTTSLPETIGGVRNWDYRFSWIRDSYFSVRSLARLGFHNEADDFRRFIERSSHCSPSGLQTMFGVYGERMLPERVITELEGYRLSKPVRIGNEASTQLQLDMYGLLIDLAWAWHKKGCSPDTDYWSFLVDTINLVLTKWREPDFGIWEVRNVPFHFVHSKMMCWVALDRGIKMANDLGFEAPIEQWQQARKEIRQAIETKGYDAERGVFIQAFDTKAMDSALLLLPIFGFIKYTDERMVRTVALIREELEVGGLLRRYARKHDNIPGDEGVFLACSFWLTICLAEQGELNEAQKVFDLAISKCNELNLLSEEYDVGCDQMLGNFPQGFTHLSLIIAAIALFEATEVAGKRQKY